MQNESFTSPQILYLLKAEFGRKPGHLSVPVKKLEFFIDFASTKSEPHTEPIIKSASTKPESPTEPAIIESFTEPAPIIRPTPLIESAPVAGPTGAIKLVSAAGPAAQIIPPGIVIISGSKDEAAIELEKKDAEGDKDSQGNEGLHGNKGIHRAFLSEGLHRAFSSEGFLLRAFTHGTFSHGGILEPMSKYLLHLPHDITFRKRDGIG